MGELVDAIDAGYGPIWGGVGSRYVIGAGGTAGRCEKRKASESCLTLYDIATGKISEDAERLDGPGRFAAYC